MDGASYGVAGSPGDGPYVEIWAKVEDGRVLDASFRTPGCPSSTAAASMLCELAIGREASKLAALTAEDLLAVLGGLPEGREAYAQMSVDALGRSLNIRDL